MDQSMSTYQKPNALNNFNKNASLVQLNYINVYIAEIKNGHYANGGHFGCRVQVWWPLWRSGCYGEV